MSASPFTYDETKEYVQEKMAEGFERGESLAEILKVAVVQAIPLDDVERFERLIDAEEEAHRKFLTTIPDCDVCCRCHEVVSRKAVVCLACAAGERDWRNGPDVSEHDVAMALRAAEDVHGGGRVPDPDAVILAREVRRLQRIVNDGRRRGVFPASGASA